MGNYLIVITSVAAFCLFAPCSSASAQSYQWQVVGRLQPASGLTSIVFRDSLHGWTAYGSDSLYHTSDGGTSWTPATSGFPFKVYALSLLDSLTIWAFGNDGTVGRIIASTNGGLTWVLKHEQYGDLILGGVVLSSHTILASGVWRAPNSGDSALVLRSRDGGST